MELFHFVATGFAQFLSDPLCVNPEPTDKAPQKSPNAPSPENPKEAKQSDHIVEVFSLVFCMFLSSNGLDD